VYCGPEKHAALPTSKFMPKMCRITTAGQSPFVDYNPIDILMGIKKGEEKRINCQKFNSVAPANLKKGYTGNLSQLFIT
jgi:hypothetical protein